MKTTSEPDIDFIWPKFKNDRERIKFFTQKYKDMPLADIFQHEYGVKIDYHEHVYMLPAEPKIGDRFKVFINSITKRDVIFDNINLKTDIVSAVNLWRYDFFKHFIPQEPVEVIVTSVDSRKIVVDPILPQFNSWISKYSKNQSYQRRVDEPHPITVRNLRLTNGGFIGDAVIEDVSNFIHEEYTIPTFIPGSQIVLNITDDFKQFEGKDVQAFVVNYNGKSTNNISLICSVKEYLKHIGNCELIKIFNEWCDETDKWKEFNEKTFEGTVTGIINSSKKTGVFIEITDLNITGLAAMPADELVAYKPHQKINVKITGFEENTYFNKEFNQIQHVAPYEIEDGSLVSCNLKPILVIA